MPYQPVIPKGSPPPLAPYSPGAKAGNVLYVSGTLALDPDHQAEVDGEVGERQGEGGRHVRGTG